MPSATAMKPVTTGKHIGFGKVILFGEHFVVYGSQAIVAGVSEYTQCELKLTPGTAGFRVVDKRPAVPGYIVEKAAEQRVAHQLVFDHLHIDTSKDGVEIHLGGPLVPSSGIGASASDVVSLSRALSEMYNLNLTDEQVNQSAFVGEGGYHGTPSGVDNTAATFGGLISFRRSSGKSIFTPITFAKPLYLVVVSTGITASTTKVVADVRALMVAHPETFANISNRYELCVTQALAAIKKGDLATVGHLMNENHTLCQQITVSCSELEAIVSTARRLGALGAKMSGTGRGGIAVALAASEEQQKHIADGLKANCPEAKFIWMYSVIPKESSLKSNL